MAELGFEPTRSTDGELRARNCPFDPVSRRLPEVVCRAAIEFLGGVLEGTRVKSMEVHRVEKPPWCCVVVSDG